MTPGAFVGVAMFATVAYLVGRYVLGPFSASIAGRRHIGAREAYALPIAVSLIVLGGAYLAAPNRSETALDTLMVVALTVIVFGLPGMLGVYVGRRHWSQH